MPTSLEEKQKYVKSIGLNPDQYDLTGWEPPVNKPAVAPVSVPEPGLYSKFNTWAKTPVTEVNFENQVKDFPELNKLVRGSLANPATDENYNIKGLQGAAKSLIDPLMSPEGLALTAVAPVYQPIARLLMGKMAAESAYELPGQVKRAWQDPSLETGSELLAGGLGTALMGAGAVYGIKPSNSSKSNNPETVAADPVPSNKFAPSQDVPNEALAKSQQTKTMLENAGIDLDTRPAFEPNVGNIPNSPDFNQIRNEAISKVVPKVAEEVKVEPSGMKPVNKYADNSGEGNLFNSGDAYNPGQAAKMRNVIGSKFKADTGVIPKGQEWKANPTRRIEDARDPQIFTPETTPKLEDPNLIRPEVLTEPRPIPSSGMRMVDQPNQLGYNPETIVGMRGKYPNTQNDMRINSPETVSTPREQIANKPVVQPLIASNERLQLQQGTGPIVTPERTAPVNVPPVQSKLPASGAKFTLPKSTLPERPLISNVPERLQLQEGIQKQFKAPELRKSISRPIIYNDPIEVKPKFSPNVEPEWKPTFNKNQEVNTGISRDYLKGGIENKQPATPIKNTKLRSAAEITSDGLKINIRPSDQGFLDVGAIGKRAAELAGKTYAEFRKGMVDTFGPRIKPYIPVIERRAKTNIGFEPTKYKNITPGEPINIKGIRPLIDEMARDPNKKEMATKSKMVAWEHPEIAGKHMATIEPSFKNLTYNQAVKVTEMIKWEDTNHKAFPNIPAELKPAYDAYRKVYSDIGDDAIKLGMPIKDANGTYRLMKKDPYSGGFGIANKVWDVLHKDQVSHPDYIKLKTDLISNLVKNKVSPALAKERFEEIAHGAKMHDLPTFRALKVSEGIPLPDSWIEPDIRISFPRYIDRAAKAQAWYKHIETNHDLMRQFGYKETPWGKSIKSKLEPIHDKDVVALQQSFSGYQQNIDPLLGGIQRFTMSNILGPSAATRDLETMGILTSAKFAKIRDVPRMYKLITKDAHRVWGNLIKNGVVRHSYTDINKLLNKGELISAKFNEAATGLNKVTFREKIHNLSNFIGQVVTESAVAGLKHDALNGRRAKIDLLEDYAPNGTWKTLPDDVLASRLTRGERGRNDASSLPSWAMGPGTAAKFAGLQRWSIEQANYFMKHAITPLIRYGDPEPLIRNILGGIVAGYVIKKTIQEPLSKAKQQLPDLVESLKAKNWKLTAYNLMALANLGGMAGTLLDIPKQVMETAMGVNTQGYKIPAVESIEQMLMHLGQTAHALGSTDDGTEWSKIVLKGLGETIKAYNQTVRQGLNIKDKLFGDPEVSKMQDSRELRVFRILNNGLSGNVGFNTVSNPLRNLDTKEFKSETDPRKAATMARELTQNYINKYRNDPEEMMKKLEGLKQNGGNNILPSPQTSPMLTQRYIQYLIRTRGQERANEIIQKYYKQQNITQFKNSLIP